MNMNGSNVNGGLKHDNNTGNIGKIENDLIDISIDLSNFGWIGSQHESYQL